MSNRTLRRYGLTAAIAALLLGNTLSAAAQQAPGTSADSWEFTLTPYLWGAGQSGSVRIGQRLPALNVDASFSDILSNIDWGAMGLFEARKDRWGVLVDTFYVQLSKTSQPLLDGALGTAKLTGSNAIVEAAGAYRLAQGRTGWIDVLGGLRYFSLDGKLALSSSIVLPAGRQESSNQDWTDVFVGVRARQPLGAAWSALEYLDIGTGGSSYSYQAIVGLGWDVSKAIGVEFGFRLLAEDYSKQSLLYNVRTGGPYLGAAIRF